MDGSFNSFDVYIRNLRAAERAKIYFNKINSNLHSTIQNNINWDNMSGSFGLYC